MGRLIDADALIKTLETYKFGAIQNEVERAYIKETVINFVKDAPTAYDTEKVVEQLEERTLNSKSAQTEAIIGMCGASANYYHGEADAYINAIDIVKKGGVE